jgi:hypothetical protein
MAAAAKADVLQLIPQLSELELLEVCTGLNLTLGDKQRRDRKTALFNLLTRYITSEDIEDKEENEQLAIFEKLRTDVQALLAAAAEDEDEETKEKLRIETEMLEKLAELKELAGKAGVRTTKFEDGAWSSSSLLEEAVSAVKESTSLENLAGGSKREDKSSKSTVTSTTVKWKEFKLQGGTIGGESQLDYGDVCFQMRDGLATYTEGEVMRGVIKSAKPGSELRTFFERAQNMSIEDFKSILRTHYRVRESSKIMDDMVANSQGAEQSLYKYVMKMMAYRDEILEVTKGEECPLGEALVKRRFTDSLLSGLRKPILRLEVQAILQRKLTDPKTLEEVEKVMARDEENERKLGKSVAKADAKALEADIVARKKEAERQEAVERRLEKLAIQVQNLEVLLRGNNKKLPELKTRDETDAKVAALIAQVQHLEAQLETYQEDAAEMKNRRQSGLGGKDGFQRKRKRFQCAQCKRDNSFCFHCSKCGEVGHYGANCKKNE